VRSTSMRTALEDYAVPVLAGVLWIALPSCAPPDGAEMNINGRMTQGLPANGKLFYFGPPLDVSFVRLDGGRDLELTHTEVGKGSFLEDVAYIVDPGDVSAGQSIQVEARCDTCDFRDDVTMGDSQDLEPPEPSSGRLLLRATGYRRDRWDLAVAGYAIDVVGDEVREAGVVLLRFRSGESEVLKVNNGTSSEGAIGANVIVDGSAPRRFCIDASVMDLAGNESDVARDICTELDPSTAPPWGAEPPPVR
jgi:hypothetical protein